MNKLYAFSLFCLIGLLSLPLAVSAASIVGSRHDLSWVTSRRPNDHGLGGLIDYKEVCVYCHTPHGANSAGGPLWNKNFTTSATSYTVYSSATLDTSPSAPGSVSLLCLNCHDGATGVSSVRNAPNSGWTDINSTIPRGFMYTSGFGSCGMCHDPASTWFSAPDQTKAYLGTDLSDDHPIGISFPDPGQDAGFNLPGDLTKGWSDLPLFNGKIECATCHDVHDPQIVPFLTVNNAASALCTRCHKK